MRNTLKQDGGMGLTSHIVGDEASLFLWAMMAYPTWNKKGSDSGAPYAGSCVTQDKVRSASAPNPQQGRAVSQHPLDCEIWGSLQAAESEQEAEEPTRAASMATTGTQGQLTDQPGCPASALRWENPNSLLSPWQGIPAALTGQANPQLGAHLQLISVPAPHAHWPWTGPQGTWIPH